MSLLNNVFDSQTINVHLQGKTKEAAFNELTDMITARYPECDKNILLKSLWEREGKLSTGIVSGTAVPHALCSGMDKVVGAIGISKMGIEYDALDNEPVHVVFLLVLGQYANEKHLRILSQISRLVKSDALELIKKAENTQEVYSILSGF